MNLRIELRQALENVARRFRHARLWSGLAICWLTWALVGLGLYVMVSRSGRALIPGGLLLVSFAVLVVTTALVCVIGALRSVRDPRWVARRIETKHPELGTGLLSAVEEDATSPAGRLGFLQTAVIRQALDHRRVNDWDETVSSRRLRVAQVAHAAALGLLAAVSIALAVQVRSRANDVALNIFRGNAADVQVDPGNTELERGAALLVVARFKGAVPGDASLVVGDDDQCVGSPRHDPQPGRPHVCRPRRVGRRRPRLIESSSRANAPRLITSTYSNIPNYSAPTPSWFSRAIRRSSPRPSRTFATSPRWRGPS